MSIIKQKGAENNSKKGMLSLLLPVYIVLSAIFIIYAAYSFFTSVVYNQGTSAGLEQGYQQAIVDLMNQAGAQCEPVALTMGDTQVDVINIACLQQSATQEVPQDTVSGE